MTDLSPALQLAVDLIANGAEIDCWLCSAIPDNVDDIARVALGSGTINVGGGMVTVEHAGTAVCLAYDVNGQLLTTTTTNMPLIVWQGTGARVRALTLK